METSYSNKPYFFVPLLKNIERYRQFNRQNLLSQERYIGKLNISIECKTPLHFGSGKLTFVESQRRFVHTLLREDDKIALPGSSFKGMLRSMFEAVTPSCVLNYPRTWPLKIGELSPCNKNSGLCLACSVFGLLSYKGKLIISSFRTDSENTIPLRLPALEQPFRTYPKPDRGERDKLTGNERLYYGDFKNTHGLDVARMSKSEFWAAKDREHYSGGNFYGRKFYKHSTNWDTVTQQAGKEYYECLNKGAVLSGTITYQGLTEEELGGLLFALGVGWKQPIVHKLGYAKPAYLGSVKLNVASEAIERYKRDSDQPDEVLKLAAKYYSKHKSELQAVIDAFAAEWSESEFGKINPMWGTQDGKLGY